MLAANTVANLRPTVTRCGLDLVRDGDQSDAVRQVTYDPERDFVPISLYVKSPFILVVNPESAGEIGPDLIAYVKQNQGKLSYSSPGAGVAQHLSMEYMKNQFGLEITHVPYRATPQSIQESGRACCDGWAEAGASLPLIRRASCVRLPYRRQQGCRCCPMCDRLPRPAARARISRRCHGTCAPARENPRDIVDRLHAEMKRALPIRAQAEDRDDRAASVRYACDRDLRVYRAPNRRSGARWSRSSGSKRRSSVRRLPPGMSGDRFNTSMRSNF